jgi:tetratricopeptide (TPR) repeat protein
MLAAVVAAVFLPALHAQTAISIPAPDASSLKLTAKSEIIQLLAKGTPDSLLAAQARLLENSIVREEERPVLLEILRGMSVLLYPPLPATDAAIRSAALKARDDPKPAGFVIDPKLGAMDQVYSVAMTQLVEASFGRIFPAPKGTPADVLTELLPMLAIFRTQDKEIARLALGYAERFEALDSFPSAIPGLVKARHEMISGDPARAVTALQKVLAAYPDVWPARLALGTSLMSHDRYAEALAMLEPIASSRARDPELLKSYAVALYRNGKLAEAELVAKRGYELCPDALDLALILAHVLIDRNEYAAAQPLVDAVGKKRPNDRLYLQFKARLAQGQNRRDEALRWSRKALQAYPEDPEAMVLLAELLFAGDESNHDEALALCRESISRFQGIAAGTVRSPIPPSPLRTALYRESRDEATRLMLLEAYRHQDWNSAARLLESADSAGLDKAVVSTILRRSGHYDEAVTFASDWYRSTPNSEAAAEAYLRSLAALATGTGLASAGGTSRGGTSVSDAALGYLNSLSAGTSGYLATGALAASSGSPLISLVIQLYSASASPMLRSYMNYLRGTLSTDQDAAIDFYRAALVERADNVEALAALAKAYAGRNDSAKALSYIRQAKSIGVSDQELLSELLALETRLTQG